jgi:hypothetical protein
MPPPYRRYLWYESIKRSQGAYPTCYCTYGTLYRLLGPLKRETLDTTSWVGTPNWNPIFVKTCRTRVMSTWFPTSNKICPCRTGHTHVYRSPFPFPIRCPWSCLYKGLWGKARIQTGACRWITRRRSRRQVSSCWRLTKVGWLHWSP